MGKGIGVVAAMFYLFGNCDIVVGASPTKPWVEPTPESCSKWEEMANSLAEPQLAYVATLDGFLQLTGRWPHIWLPNCGPASCSAVLVLGYLVRSPLGAVSFTLVAEKGTLFEIGVWNHLERALDPLRFFSAVPGQPAQTAQIGEEHLRCGWVEIHVVLEKDLSAPAASGRDRIAMPDVTLGPS